MRRVVNDRSDGDSAELGEVHSELACVGAPCPASAAAVHPGRPKLFIHDEGELTTRPVADPRDPSLLFTPNVLGPRGFDRSVWTGRYVDPDTEADFVAFSHRSRWGRVPVGVAILALALRVSLIATSSELPPFRIGATVVAIFILVYCAVGCVFSSAGVADRLPLSKLLTRRVRARWSSTLLATCCVFGAISYCGAWRPGNHNTWEIPSTNRTDPGSRMQVRTIVEDGAVVFGALAFTSQLATFLPPAILCAIVSTVVVLAVWPQRWDTPASLANMFTSTVVAGLLVAAWEQQHRAHFRARASAAWQARRGAALLVMLDSLLLRSKSTCVTTLRQVSVDNSMQHGTENEAANPAGCACAAIHFRIVPTGDVAGTALALKTALVGSLERAVAGFTQVSGPGSRRVAASGLDARLVLATSDALPDAVVLRACAFARAVQRDFARQLQDAPAPAAGGLPVIAALPEAVQLAVAIVAAPGPVSGAVDALPMEWGLRRAFAAAEAAVRAGAAGPGQIVVVGPPPSLGGAFELRPAAAAAAPSASADPAPTVLVGMPQTVDAVAVCRDAWDRMLDQLGRPDDDDDDDDGAADGPPIEPPALPLPAEYGGLLSADADAALPVCWGFPRGLRFEDADAEAVFRGSENAGALRHSVVATSAWVTAVLAVLYSWHGVARPGGLTWLFVGLSAIATVLQWAVLRPVQPGQRRWAVATVVLYPLQSAALIAALRFHPDPMNPAKLHQSWLTFVAAHVYIVALPTCVPFFAALLIIAPTYALTLMWGASARSINDNSNSAVLLEMLPASIAVAFYFVLVNAVRYSARLHFADHLLSHRSSARWTDARAEFRASLSRAMPQAVAERVVRQLTARIGKTSHAREAAAAAADGMHHSTACSFDNGCLCFVELRTGPLPRTQWEVLARAGRFNLAGVLAANHIPASVNAPAPVSAGAGHDHEPLPPDGSGDDDSESVGTASIDGDGVLDVPRTPPGYPRRLLQLPTPDPDDAAALDAAFRGAHGRIEQALLLFRETEDAAHRPPPFLTRCGPSAWVVLHSDAECAGSALRHFGDVLDRIRVGPNFHVAVGSGNGGVAGDLVGTETCAYELCGPAMDAAVASLSAARGLNALA